MTRFDAAAPADRRRLYVEAIGAHRERGSDFLTLEADPSALETDADPASGADADGPDPELGVPWIQFADGTVNLDCTEAELEALTSVLDSYPAFKVDDIHRPEEAEGVNVRVSAKADRNRIAQFFDAVFRQVYGLEEDFRAWVVEL